MDFTGTFGEQALCSGHPGAGFTRAACRIRGRLQLSENFGPGPHGRRYRSGSFHVLLESVSPSVGLPVSGSVSGD